MRLLFLTVRNYRLHQETTVTFDAARTLIGGPNESGKSTLVEAVHRVLFVRARTTNKLQQAMRSALHTGHPEVSLSFEARGQVWQVEKRFSGSSGQARLSIKEGSTWQGDEAETRLAELLGTEAGISSIKQLEAQWAHLWVWQGRSGDDPAEQATEHRDALVQRLQQEGLDAVMQSDFDQRVRERIASAYAELFTPTGKPRAGSRPEVAGQQLEAAVAALAQAQEAMQRLEDAVQAHQQAEITLTSVDAALPSLQAQKQQTEARLQKVRELRTLEQQQTRDLEMAATAHAQLRMENTQLDDWRQQAAVLQEDLKAQEQQLAQLEVRRQEAREAVQQQETFMRQQADAVREARVKVDCAAAFVTLFERTERHAALAKRVEEAGQMKTELQKRREELSPLPALTSQDLSDLRALESALHQACAALDAIAAGLELLSSGQPVRVNGERLEPGRKLTVVSAVELQIGEDTRLLLSPGGGTSLGDARSKADGARRALQEELDRWALPDVAQATRKFEQAQALRQSCLQIEAQWKALGGEGLFKEFEAATVALHAARAEAFQRHEALTVKITEPASLKEAQAWEADARTELGKADRDESVAREVQTKDRQQLEAAEQAVQKQSHGLNSKRQELTELHVRVQYAEDRLGDAAARKQKLAQADESEAKARASLEATQQSLKNLQPEMLESDLARFTRAVLAQEQQRREAETQLAVTRSQLTLDGRTDPQTELQQAQARVAGLKDAHELELRRAKAMERLHALFNQSRESIDRRLVQPLADRISGYLRCVFGPDCEARVQVAEDGRLGLEISRADGAFAFETLSGGAKEQAAAAVRLAMAEILAAGHDGCLPLVFDDAFAYADPQRVQTLQRMLDLAAARGLQVIVLSCDPANYSAFGAAEIHLPGRRG